MKGTKALAGMLVLLLAASLAACGRPASQETAASAPAGTAAEEAPAQGNTEETVTADTAADLSRSVTAGTEEYRGFLMDNVLYSENDGDIHYHIYVPESYDGSEPYALLVTLPGYEGLYFQGMGVNLEVEASMETAHSSPLMRRLWAGCLSRQKNKIFRRLEEMIMRNQKILITYRFFSRKNFGNCWRKMM